jgi:hypothetical protein
MKTALKSFCLLLLSEAETGKGMPDSVEEISSEGDETKQQGKVFWLVSQTIFWQESSSFARGRKTPQQ